MGIGENYRRICRQVADAAVQCGRSAADVRIVCVSKTVGVEQVRQAIDAGAHDFGENRPDFLQEKALALPAENWHCIGHIQSRKIPQIVSHASLVHSVYQPHHLPMIDEQARLLGKVQDILIEVNVSGEESKDGCQPAEAGDLVRLALGLPNVRPVGLMTMAPQGDIEAARQTFDGLARLLQDIRRGLPQKDAEAFKELSMGMSEDWPVAIACGATVIRVGRAIFSEDFC